MEKKDLPHKNIPALGTVRALFLLPTMQSSAFKPFGSTSTPRNRQQVMPDTPIRHTTSSAKQEVMERKFLLSSSRAQPAASAPPPPSARLLFSRAVLSSPLLSHTPPPPTTTATNKRVKEDLLSSPNSRCVSPCSLDENTELKEIYRDAHEEDSSSDDDNEQGLPPKSIPTVDVDLDLGCGNFGKVYLVTCRENKRKYALKESKQLLSTLQRDNYISSLRRWDLISTHRNIVSFFRAWQDDARLYILMGYCAGGTLESYCARHAVSEQQLLVCLCDMLSALEFIHNNRLVHMDCKPANICVNSRGECMLCDFDQLQQEGAPYTESDFTYAAGETRQSCYLVHGSADVFAMAISFLELALGSRLPETGWEWVALRDSAETTLQFLQVQRTHPTLAALILPALRSDPANRPCAQVMLQAFPATLTVRLRVSIEDVPQQTHNNRPASANLVTPSLPAAPPLNLVMCEETLSDKFNSVLVSPKGSFPVIGLSPRSSRMTSPVSFQASPPARTTTTTGAMVSSPVPFMSRSSRS